MKKIVLAIVSLVAGAVMMATPVMALDPVDCSKIDDAGLREAAGCGSTQDKDLVSEGVRILNTVLGIVMLIVVVMIIASGYIYVTSAGDPGKAKQAQSALVYSIIGMVVCILSLAIVNFVGGIIDTGSSSSNDSSSSSSP